MVEIVSNTLPQSQRQQFELEVVAALGNRPVSESWEVSLLGSPTLARIVVFIRRAGGGFRRAWIFDEPHESVRSEIEDGLRAAGF